MIDSALFVPECWADTALMKCLLDVPNADELVNHGQGIGDVCRILRDDKGLRRGRLQVGMVDNDSAFYQHGYLMEFTQRVIGINSRADMCKQDIHCVMQHPVRTEQFLIVLNPACDLWLLRAADQAGIPLAEMGIPTDLRSFKKISKRNGVFPNPKMDELLERIREARPPMFQELAGFVASIMALAPPHGQ